MVIRISKPSDFTLSKAFQDNGRCLLVCPALVFAMVFSYTKAAIYGAYLSLIVEADSYEISCSKKKHTTL